MMVVGGHSFCDGSAASWAEGKLIYVYSSQLNTLLSCLFKH